MSHFPNGPYYSEKNYNYDTDDTQYYTGTQNICMFWQILLLGVHLYDFVPENLMNGDLCMGRTACRV